MVDGNPDAAANRPLREFADRVLGPRLTIRDRSRDVGRQSVVWRVDTASGERVYVKQHEARFLFDRETRAFDEWVPRLPEVDWFTISRLLARSEDHLAIVVTEVPGTILDGSDATDREREETVRLAGRFAATLHAVPYEDDDPASLVPASLARVERYLEAAIPDVGAPTVEWALGLIRDGDPFAGARRVVTHHDFAPRNWLFERREQGLRFGVIDWERARPDMWVHDFQRMAWDDWVREPRLRDAFFDGYGRRPTAKEEHQLNLWSLVNAIAAIPWTTARGDVAFERRMRAVIDELRAVL